MAVEKRKGLLRLTKAHDCFPFEATTPRGKFYGALVFRHEFPITNVTTLRCADARVPFRPGTEGTIKLSDSNYLSATSLTYTGVVRWCIMVEVVPNKK